MNASLWDATSIATILAGLAAAFSVLYRVISEQNDIHKRDLETSNDYWKEEFQILRAEIDVLRDDLREVRAERDAAQARAAVLEAEVRHLRQKIEEIQKETTSQ